VTDTPMLWWIIAWIPIVAAMMVIESRSHAGTGLVIAYVLQLVVLHWLAAAIYLLPWYWNLNEAVVFAGLRESTFALSGLAIGVAATLLMGRRPRVSDSFERSALAEARILRAYFAIGVVAYAVLAPRVADVPTISAVVNGASNCAVLALALACWNSSHRPRGGLWRWGLAATLFPFVTIVTQGFLGYGLAAVLIIFAFVASYYRPRWKVLAFAVFVAYFGLSLYVTYMRDRSDIREVVWGGESVGARLDRLAGTFADPEAFDITNLDHLQRIDLRLNQNYLVGSAVMYLSTRDSLFARGETLWDALLAPVPRLLWPDKPIVAGSGDLVTRFTGIRFAEGTSVGIGQVMELYVNFGSPGVFVGFIVIGALLAFVDRRAAECRDRGSWSRFTYWFLPGVSMLQTGGSLVEVTSSAAAALTVALLVARVTERATAPMPGAAAAKRGLAVSIGDPPR